VEEVSPSGCKGGPDEGKPLGTFSLAKSRLTKDSILLSMSYFRASILDSMVELMDELMVELLALSCRNSFWVVEKSDDNVLKRASRSYMRVWAMVKGGTGRVQVGLHRKGVMR
jgi:predicted thioredoxin/glutaredoxin